MNRSRCRICKFLKDHRFAKAQWSAEVNKALSLKELQTVLRVLGCEVSTSTISRHLTECEGINLYQTNMGKVKKAVKSPFKKLSDFFNPKEETDTEGDIPCYICRNLAKKEDLVFDCLLHVYLCEKCFFRRSVEKPETKSRRSRINTKVLLRKLEEARRRAKR